VARLSEQQYNYAECETVQLLLDRGADINAPAGIYDTVLEVVVSRVIPRQDLIELLLDRGEGINSPLYGLSNSLGTKSLCNRQSLESFVEDQWEVDDQWEDIDQQWNNLLQTISERSTFMGLLIRYGAWFEWEEDEQEHRGRHRRAISLTADVHSQVDNDWIKRVQQSRRSQSLE
jgi:hypothetical protein